METQWEYVQKHTDSLPQVILSFLILGSGDLDPSVLSDTGENVDTGSDYEDQVNKI